MDDPCECGVQDPERESNKQPGERPAASCSRSERTVFRSQLAAGGCKAKAVFGGAGA